MKRSDEGSALVEFLGVGFLLMVPLVYLVVVLAALQGAMFAVEGAAREVTRMYVISASDEAAAMSAAQVALADHGLEPDKVEVSCPNGCETPGGRVKVSVSTQVRMPWLPDFFYKIVPLSVAVSAEHVAELDSLRVRP